ncbi:MhpC Predicted hydrolases or acyltransferases (alpha/beta hydrolase superfamily) [Burkholderiaceae bacterium]
MWNLKQELDAAQSLAKRIEIPTPSGVQVWHVWNKDAGHPLVLLHGGSGSWNHWVRNVVPLSQQRSVWALDTPGLGDSELPLRALDADDLAMPLEQGLQQLFGSEALDVVGFSFGGLVAGFAAAHWPTRFKRLVLVGVPGLGLSNNILNMRGFRDNMTDDERMAVHKNNLLAIMLHNEALVTPDLLEMQAQNVSRDRLRRRRIARSDALLHQQTHWTCEVYGIWGELDALYKGKMHLLPERLSACNLQSFQMIDDAGHWVQYEQAEAFNEALQTCLPLSL